MSQIQEYTIRELIRTVCIARMKTESNLGPASVRVSTVPSERDVW